MIFKYELGFVVFTWPNLCSLDLSLPFIVLVGRNFVFDIYKLVKTYFFQYGSKRSSGIQGQIHVLTIFHDFDIAVPQ